MPISGNYSKSNQISMNYQEVVNKPNLENSSKKTKISEIFFSILDSIKISVYSNMHSIKTNVYSTMCSIKLNANSLIERVCLYVKGMFEKTSADATTNESFNPSGENSDARTEKISSTPPITEVLDSEKSVTETPNKAENSSNDEVKDSFVDILCSMMSSKPLTAKELMRRDQEQDSYRMERMFRCKTKSLFSLFL